MHNKAILLLLCAAFGEGQRRDLAWPPLHGQAPTQVTDGHHGLAARSFAPEHLRSKLVRYMEENWGLSDGLMFGPEEFGGQHTKLWWEAAKTDKWRDEPDDDARTAKAPDCSSPPPPTPLAPSPPQPVPISPARTPASSPTPPSPNNAQLLIEPAAPRWALELEERRVAAGERLSRAMVEMAAGINTVAKCLERTVQSLQDITSACFAKPSPARGVLSSSSPPPQPPQVSPAAQPYAPAGHEYEAMDQGARCEPVQPRLTAEKTGQKAFDKCIEYQEKYILPCERDVTQSGSRGRLDYCHHSTGDHLIISGTAARKGEFPHMVLLGYGKVEELQWLCSGAIISERFILTAGSCIRSPSGPVSYALTGALAPADAADRTKLYGVETIAKHPDYRPPHKYNDIALLETRDDMNLNQFALPACIHNGDDVDDGSAIATGWGLNENLNAISDLQKAIIVKNTTDECAKKYPTTRLMRQGFDEKTQTCYEDQNFPRDKCADDGSPLQIINKKIYCMYTIVGVKSFGPRCDVVKKPVIYTKVANYVSWIESIVWP